jgi:hypothetical protein
MTTMSPHDARAAILAGTAPDGLTVDGWLDLVDCTGLTALPDGLTVGGWLHLAGCTGLTALPDGLTVGGSLHLVDCTGLTALPDGLTVGGWLHLAGCTGLTALPDGLTVGGSLHLVDCTGLTALPDGLTVGGCLDLEVCTGLPHIYADPGRSYHLRRVEAPDGPRWNAGCRHFTTEQALAHWGSPSYPDPSRGAAYVAAIRQSLADKPA